MATLVLLGVVIAFVAMALCSMKDGKPKEVVGFTSVAFTALMALTFVAAPAELGYGRVSSMPEPLTKRLETGAIYQVVAIKSVTDDGEKIFLVQQEDTNDYRVIRVKFAGFIPGRFTLIDGRSVEVK